MNTVENTPTKHIILSALLKPLYPTGMIYVACLVSCSFFLFKPQPLLSSLLISSTLLFLFFLYSIAWLNNIVDGKTASLKWYSVFEKVDLFEVAQHVALILTLSLILQYLIQYQLIALSIAIGIISVFILPCILMIAHTKKSVVRALNPGLWAHYLHYLGLDYVVLVITFSVMLSIIGGVYFFIEPMLPKLIAHISAIYLSIYFSITLYCLMGYILYKNKQALGINMQKQYTHLPIKQSTKLLLEEAAEKIHAGEINEAAQIYGKIIAIESLNLDFHQQYQDLLYQLKDVKTLNFHSRNFIRKAICRNQGMKAIDVYNRIRKLIPDFHLDEVPVAISLAKVMRNLRSYELAASVLENLHQHCPNDPAIPEAYLLLSNIYTENLNQDKKAKRVLEFTLIHFPQHPLQLEIKNHLDCLRDLNKSSQK